MVVLSEEIAQQKKEFIQHIFEKIKNVSNDRSFYIHIYYIIASLGLQRKAEEEDLFKHKDWSNPKCREDIVKGVHRFIKKYIR